MKKIFFFLATITAMAACQQNKTTNQEAEVSTSHQKTSEAFPLSNLDTSISPCEDFYQYAIGGWLKENPVPSTESRWSSFNVVLDANNRKIRTILNEFSSGDFEVGSMEQKIGDFYRSAMDSSQADALGIEPLNREFSRIGGLKKSEDIIPLIAHHRSVGIGSLFGIYVSQDDKNSEAYITHLYQGGLGLPDRDYYLKEDEKSKNIQEAYQSHIGKMFALMGNKEAEANAQAVYEIEKKLAENSMTRVERRDPEKTYNKMSVEQLRTIAPNVNWESYFNGVGLKKVDELIVSQPDFIKATAGFIETIDLDDWKYYLTWKVLNAYAGSLSSDFVNQNFAFYGETLSGTKEIKPRWKRALSKINGGIGQLLGKAFVKRHFTENSKEVVSNMVENLRSAFRNRINQLAWMSAETKEKALEKLEAFNYKIGYPDKWRDYSALDITADNLIDNVMKANKFNFDYMMNKLGNPVDKDEWFMTPQTVNAYYSSSKNEIVFPAGILQPPFYSDVADAALNYGGIGAVIGHEFTHGFDDQGSKYDHAGNLENWWTEDDRQRFDERANIVVQQFNGFEPLDSLYVNGKLTLGENIADLGGVTLAYYALKEELGDQAVELIDGFSPEERFFLGWAQVWHMNMTDEELRKRIATDSHSPGEYRVNGPLSNMSEFAKAFGCGKGDKMVNTDSTRALIW